MKTIAFISLIFGVAILIVVVKVHNNANYSYLVEGKTRTYFLKKQIDSMKQSPLCEPTLNCFKKFYEQNDQIKYASDLVLFSTAATIICKKEGTCVDSSMDWMIENFKLADLWMYKSRLGEVKNIDQVRRLQFKFIDFFLRNRRQTLERRYLVEKFELEKTIIKSQITKIDIRINEVTKALLNL